MESVQPLFRVIRSASALWPYYVGIVVISSVTAALHLVSPFIIREATDTIVEGKDLDPIVWLAVALFAAYSANTLMQNIGEYLGDVVSARIRQTLSTRYFAKLLSLCPKAISTARSPARSSPAWTARS